MRLGFHPSVVTLTMNPCIDETTSVRHVVAAEICAAAWRRPSDAPGEGQAQSS